ncbi:hypothetical protein V2J09_011755 [Rumex salicifolius]
MGASHSRNSDTSSFDEVYYSSNEENEYEDAKETPSPYDRRKPQSPSSLNDVEAKLKSLRLKYESRNPNPALKNPVRLYHHIGGNNPNAKWITSENLTSYAFVKRTEDELEGDDNDFDDDDEVLRKNSFWILKIGSKIRVMVGEEMQMKSVGHHCRVDFVAGGVWALKFFDGDAHKVFVKRFQDCLFENTYGYEATDENKTKVYGKDFIGWANPQAADDSLWEDAENDIKTPSSNTPFRGTHDLRKEFEEAADGSGIQSIALGALDYSFLVGESGIQVVKNFSHGIHGKGAYVSFNGGSIGGKTNMASSIPMKTLLIREERNMLMMSSINEGKPQSSGLHQLDIETGKVVTEWKFEKDRTDITMRDIINDSKGAQLDPSGSTFLGLDDNRLCRWDMRDRHGVVQDLATESTAVLNWTQGHNFCRGTNFQCFATTGDGSIVVGSRDGKIRLYSVSSMRQAKTVFPGLGSPITHVDVTYDGKWILGTTDTCLVLICTLFVDKDGKMKTGFSGRMGNKISAPRYLKLTPLDAHLAGANKFRGAQFSWVTEQGKQERHLVATVGKFSVIWNFQQVKDSSHECYQNQNDLKSCYCYKIVLKDDSIIDSRFMHDKFSVTEAPEAPLVVATQMKLPLPVSLKLLLNLSPFELTALASPKCWLAQLLLSTFSVPYVLTQQLIWHHRPLETPPLIALANPSFFPWLPSLLNELH